MNRIALSWKDIPEPAWAAAISAFAEGILDRVGKSDWELSLVLCGDEFIHELNRSYRGLDRPTDVLSFTLGDTVEGESGPVFLAGDIVISLPAVYRNAADFSVDPDEELKRLVIHGILHLAGMDHEDDDPARPMLAEQERILAAAACGRIL